MKKLGLLFLLTLMLSTTTIAAAIDGKLDNGEVYETYQPMCMMISDIQSWVGQLYIDEDVDTLSIYYQQMPSIVNNTYYASTSPKLSERYGSDKAEIIFRDADGVEVLKIKVDYIEKVSDDPLEYESEGVWGGEGSVITGDPAYVLNATTSLDYNFNVLSCSINYTTDSPTDCEGWILENGYEVKINKSVFGEVGFGSVEIKEVHNSPETTIKPVECAMICVDGDEDSYTAPQIAVGCGKCDSEINNLTFQYNGDDPVQINITIKKTGETIFYKLISIGEQFTIYGALANDGKLSKELYFYVDETAIDVGERDNLHLSCSDKKVLPGLTFGDFEIIKGTSAKGGTLCPLPGTEQDCGPQEDCDDTNPTINLNADEICNDEIDNDCDKDKDCDDEDCDDDPACTDDVPEMGRNVTAVIAVLSILAVVLVVISKKK